MLGHADIQTTMIFLHEQDRIVNAAEHHIPNSSRPLSPRGYQTVHSRGGRGDKAANPGGPSRREARPAHALGRKSHGTIDVRR